MADNQDDVIQHLLKIEDEASEVIKEAQVEAESIIAAARVRADSAFKAGFEKIADSIEKNEASLRERIASSHKLKIQEYQDSLSSFNKDTDSFSKLMDGLLKA
ncbi:hypothetical protein [Treponema sp.]|jgi:F0F1-type ATP synthase membrane subunit b/b'|uniref:hypothetical protein n=1 Tax=Treponema sp. TaxID=166 RepID=UPI00257ADCEB|nr:hypothetical protein [Treponema sp.]MBE6353437.1 hypothetical protein [Treponema sp.]